MSLATSSDVMKVPLAVFAFLAFPMFSESLTKALRGKILDRPHSPSLSPALAEDFDGSGAHRGGEGAIINAPRPRAAVARLPCPGLHSVALTGPQYGVWTFFVAT